MFAVCDMPCGAFGRHGPCVHCAGIRLDSARSRAVANDAGKVCEVTRRCKRQRIDFCSRMGRANTDS
jgi:hypothetical protein